MAATLRQDLATPLFADVDLLGMLPYKGKIDSLMRKTEIVQAITSLRARGSDAHLWLPGVGTLNGLTTGNYLESTGNTLATVDNPTGLVLDALGAVGVELVTNGGFADATGWTVPTGWAVGSGVAAVTATSSSLLCTQYTPVTGKTYLVTFDCTATGGTLYVATGSGTAASFTTSGPKRCILVCGATPSRAIEWYGGAVSGSVDNISVREVSGIHLTQSTTANKPLLRRGLWNLLTYSSDFSQWIKQTGVTLGTNVADPSGGNAAITVNWSGCAVGQGLIRTGAATVAGAVYTRAVWVKADSAGTVLLKDPAITSGTSTLTLSDQWQLVLLSESNAGVLSGVWLAKTALSPATVYVYSAGVFAGTLTAAQILAAGGIPVTTTAAASNPDSGKYSWAFDGSNDHLALGSVPFQMGDDFAVVAGATSHNNSGYPTIAALAYRTGGYCAGMLWLHSNNTLYSTYKNDADTIVNVSAGVTTIGTSFVGAARKVGDSVVTRLNGVPGTAGTAPSGAATLNVSSIGAAWHNGPIGPVLAIKGTVTDAELLMYERLVAALTPGAPSF